VETPNQSPDSNPYAASEKVVIDILGDKYVAKQLASRPLRLMAYLVDGLAYTIPMTIAIILLMETNIVPQESVVKAIEAQDFSTLPDIMMLSILLISATVFFINARLLHRDGQTIGKKALKIKIVRTDYTQASLFRILLLRYAVMGLIGTIPVIGNVITLANYLMIFNKDHRCLHDHIADTIVVKIEQPETSQMA